MMPGVLLVYIALAAANLYPQGAEPLTYHPAATLGAAAALALVVYAAHRAVAARFLRDHGAGDRGAARRYRRAGPLAALLLFTGYLALIYLGHWPLLVEESLTAAFPWLFWETDLALADTALTFVTMALFLALVLMPLAAALSAAWRGLYPAERTIRGGVLPRGAFLRFRAQSLLAFGLLPPLLLFSLYHAILNMPVWRDEMEVYPFLVWTGMAVLFLGLFAFFPVLIRMGFRARPVPPGPLRDRLDACCARAGFRCRELLVWDTCGTRTLNAFIAGLVPGLRYVFFTDALLERLEPEEVEAVLAHEIGHAACHHLRWYGILTVGFVALTASIMEWESRYFGEELLPMVLTQLLLLALFFGGVLGFLSRRFETEADLYAARLLGDPRRFITALRKVIHLNGIPAVRGSWRHPSPAQRLAFLAGVARFPLIESRFIARLRLLMRVAGVAVLLCLAGAGRTAARDLEEAPGRREDLRRRERAVALRKEAADLERKGLTDEALDRLRKARALLPDNPVLLIHLGEVQEKAGLPAEARQSYLEADRRGPRGLRLRQYLADRLKRR